MERAMRMFVATTLAFGLCAGCAHRTTTVRRTETIRQEPRQDTYVAPPVVEQQETVIKRSHTHSEEDD